MRITNKYGLPEALVRAVQNDDYDRGDADITCTELISPPRQIELRRLHRDKIVEDVSECLYRLWGQCIHTILERAAMDEFVEKRLTAECNGWTISGKVDLIVSKNHNTIVDWKSPSVFNVRDGHKDEWIWQLQTLAWLAEKNGIQVHALENDVMFRDYRPSEARRWSAWYPTKAMNMPTELWSMEKRQGFVEARVYLHQQARLELPLCSKTDTWQGRRCAGYCNVFFTCFQANKDLAPGNPKPNSVRQPVKTTG